MRLKLQSLSDRGQPRRERLVLKVVADTDVGEYAVLRAFQESGAPTDLIDGAYWFPDKHVRAGDLVVLYTKPGSPSEKDLLSGATAHFFYWGEEDPLWETRRYCPVLLHVDDWHHLRT